MLSSEPTQYMRPGYIHSWMSTVPSAWVATAVAMLVRSDGKPGQTCDCTFGIAPPRSCSMTNRPDAFTMRSSPFSSVSTPSRLNTMRVMRRYCGTAFLMVISPCVIAAAPISEPTSM